jgi:uncharacterized membrane protein HdeD (DUF308 family)
MGTVLIGIIAVVSACSIGGAYVHFKLRKRALGCAELAICVFTQIFTLKLLFRPPTSVLAVPAAVGTILLSVALLFLLGPDDYDKQRDRGRT